MPNIYPFQGAETRLVQETSYGVTPGSPAFVRLNGFGVTLGATIETDPFAPPGAMVPTITLINDDFATGAVEGRLDYNSLAFVLAGLFGNPTITALGGAPPAYKWEWTWGGRRPNRPISYTIHYGFPESADVATGFIFNTLEIGGGRADGFDVSGDGFAKAVLAGQALGGIVNEIQSLTGTAVTAGTFTLSFNGEVTAPIVFNASAAIIQAAIEALPTPQPGDVLCTGGPINTTPVVITWLGAYAGQNVAQIIVSNTGLTGTIAATTTTPGNDTVLDIGAVPAGAVHGNVYLDSTWAGLGSTQLLYCYTMTLSIGERMQRVRPINKSKSSDGVIDMSDQEHTLALMLGRNAVADAQLAKLRSGTQSFCRSEWLGDVISGANSFLLQFDTSVIYTEVGDPTDQDGVHAREYTGRLSIDPVSTNVIKATLVNRLPSLSGT